MTLSGKTVLITGAARRLGREMALAVASQGGNVILHHGHSAAEAERVADVIRLTGSKCWVISANLSSPSEAKNLMDQAIALSSIDAIINNAAVFHPEEVGDTSVELWQSTLDLNLTAPFLISQIFAQSLTQGARGRIINIVDWRALRPGKDHFAYTISKSALAAMTRSLAQALAPNVSVNGVALGAILPPSGEPENPHLLDDVPLKRWATMEELHSAILFLLQGPADITGAIIHLDGGRHII